MYLADDDPDFREFRNRFRIASRREPDHAAVLGYNAMQVLLQALRGGARSREALRDQLTHMPEVNGIGGRIVLDTQRGSNTNVKILRLIQGGAVPVIRAGEAASRETESVAP